MDSSYAAKLPMFTTGAAVALVLMLVMAVSAPVLGTLYWLRGNELGRLEGELTASKASARKAWQKVYDLQDAEEKAESEEMGKLRVQLWEVQQKADACAPKK